MSLRRLASILQTSCRFALSGLLLAALAGTASCQSAPAPAPVASVAPYPHLISQVTFAVSGDVIPHESVREAAGSGPEGWAGLLADVSDVFHRADFAFVNMETPVAPQHTHGTKPFMFDAPVDLIAGLKLSGVKIVSFANNHVMDQGQPGFVETREHLREQGMLFAGSGDTAATAWQPVFTEKNGIKVGWLGMTRWLNGNRNPENPDAPHVNFFPYPDDNAGNAPGMDEAGVLAAVKAARAQCDLLVVSIHWGTEYAPAPKPGDIEMAHKMLDAGATVIVGHHPHVLQPVETYKTADGRKALIFYSLGNFLSNQSRPYVDGISPEQEGDPRDTIVGEFSIVRRDYGSNGVKIELGDVDILPGWGINSRTDITRNGANSIHPVLIDKEEPLLQAKISAIGAETTPTAAEKTQLSEAKALLKTLEDRRKAIVNRVGATYVAPAGK